MTKPNETKKITTIIETPRNDFEIVHYMCQGFNIILVKTKADPIILIKLLLKCISDRTKLKCINTKKYFEIYFQSLNGPYEICM